MDRAGGEAALLELVGEVGGGALGAAEDHGQSPALGLQDPRDHLGLVHVVRAVDELLGVRDRRALVVRRGGADVRGLRHVAAGETDDRARHGGREQHGLAPDRKQVDDLLDVGQEAQVEHLVGLVEDERLHVRQVQLLLPGEVEQPARGADDHVDAFLQGLDLGLVGPAAVDRGDAHVAHLAGGQQVVGHLGAQLARGDDDEGLRGVGEVLGLRAARLHVHRDGDALEERKAEAERLAGAGLGLADDVRARQGHGKRHLLDGEGSDDADGFQGLGGLGEDPELSERRSQGAASSVCAVRGERGGRVGTVPGTSAALRRCRRTRDHCRRSSARTAEGSLRSSYARCRTVREGCRVGADRATDRASSYGWPVEHVGVLSRRITTIPRIRAHAMADLVT